MVDNTERTGKQILNELEALQGLFEAYGFDFSRISILNAIALNTKIRELVENSLIE